MSKSDDTTLAGLPADLSRRQLALGGLSLAAAATVIPGAAAAKPARFTLEDREGIRDLFTRYLWAYDCADEQEFLDLFSEDALVVGRGKVYQGREAILGWFRYLTAMREKEGDDIWMHEAGQFHFAPNGKTCVVYAYATHFNANTPKGTKGVRSLGYFACECVRVGDSWRFRRFSISGWDGTKVPWKKPLPWDGLGQG